MFMAFQGLRFRIAGIAKIAVEAQIMQMADPHLMARFDRGIRIGLGKFLGQRHLRRVAVEDEYSFRVHVVFLINQKLLTVLTLTDLDENQETLALFFSQVNF